MCRTTGLPFAGVHLALDEGSDGDRHDLVAVARSSTQASMRSGSVLSESQATVALELRTPTAQTLPTAAPGVHLEPWRPVRPVSGGIQTPSLRAATGSR
jgi:hypothetical protein